MYEVICDKISEIEEERIDPIILVDGAPNPDMMVLSYQLRWVRLNAWGDSSKALLLASPANHDFKFWRFLMQRYAGSCDMTA